MFDDKGNMDQDLLMRTILENGQEDIPAHIWDGISEGLDVHARRRRTVLWLRRVSLSVAAAAAVVIGVVTGPGETGETGDIVPAGHSQDMVAVVERPPVQQETQKKIQKETAAAVEMTIEKKAEQIAAMEVTAQAITPEENEVPEQEPVKQISKDPAPEKKDIPASDLTKIWENEFRDDQLHEEKKRRITFTISGITGSNNPKDRVRSGALRQPSYSMAPTRTSIAESSKKNTFGIPLSFGAGVKISLSDKWSVGTGIEYTLLSRKFYGTYVKVNDKGGIEHSTYSDIRNNQHYVGIPVNAFYNILSNGHINFYAYAGGAAERCVSDSYHLLNTSIVHKEDVSGLQFSANAGLGVEFMTRRHLSLYVDPRIRYYFHGNQPKSIRTEQPLMASIEMGMRFRL